MTYAHLLEIIQNMTEETETEKCDSLCQRG